MTALITGASRGIGAACARALKAAGYDVIINYNNSEKAAQELATELGAKAIKADVSDAAQVRKMFEEAGSVDVLVCNAGISMFKMFCDMTADNWNRIFSVNFVGTVNCIEEALPSMIHNKFGRIITMSSIWGVTGASCESAYSATKAAIIGLSKSLAKELGPSGITVNCIAPGVIDTDMNAHLTHDIIEELKEETPVCAIGRAEDVAQAVCYLASAPFVTGQVLGVNGGFLI
ncbi:MAG: 3-oxoacyl-ACP reductase FabG [Oscillospiraceae bacterium]|nr:3-oxoacyl-ACP reductase FabG [Oscillospiraceae bacterium]